MDAAVKKLRQHADFPKTPIRAVQQRQSLRRVVWYLWTACGGHALDPAPIGCRLIAWADDTRQHRLMQHRHTTAVDLIEKTLEFNPAKRLSVNDALKHPYLAKFRQPELETECKTPFDFEFEKVPMTKHRLREFIWEEVLAYRPAAKAKHERWLKNELERQRKAAQKTVPNPAQPSPMVLPPHPSPVAAPPPPLCRSPHCRVRCCRVAQKLG